jgi:hypothetical protein
MMSLLLYQAPALVASEQLTFLVIWPSTISRKYPVSRMPPTWHDCTSFQSSHCLFASWLHCVTSLPIEYELFFYSSATAFVDVFYLMKEDVAKHVHTLADCWITMPSRLCRTLAAWIFFEDCQFIWGKMMIRTLMTSRSLSNNLITDVADNAFDDLGFRILTIVYVRFI